MHVVGCRENEHGKQFSTDGWLDCVLCLVTDVVTFMLLFLHVELGVVYVPWFFCLLCTFLPGSICQ